MSGLTYLLLAGLLAAAALAAWQARRAGRLAETLERSARIQRDGAEQQTQLTGQVQHLQARLAALGDASATGLLLVDGEHRITWGNRAAWDLLGLAEPGIGRTCMGLPAGLELNQAVADAISGGRPLVRQAAAENRTLRIRAAGLSGVAEGGAAVVIEDVTELQRLGRARRDLVANISHELRTPLANLTVAAETLRKGGRADKALRRTLIGQIEDEVQLLSQLSEEMIDLAQIESGRAVLRLVPTAVQPLVRRGLKHLRRQAEAKKQTVNIAAPEGLLALADEQHVARVIGNLVQNAIKFTPQGGAISIAAEASGEDVIVSVADNGPGIARDEQVRIFERFYKADRARSTGGTGLGLAIARHIVEGHGGRIWVESTPGQGAKFCFTLPAA